jgi:hypothetical protein
MKHKYTTLYLIIAALTAIFFMRTLLAPIVNMPRSFEIYDTLTVVGSLFVLLKGYRGLQQGDWTIALILGIVIGVEMKFTSLFSPYPFFGIVKANTGQAILRGAFTTIASLGGLAIMRQGGPVSFPLADGDWRRTRRSVLLGLGVGLPLAVINVFALQATQGHSIDWQSPLAALADAIQPAIVEEVVYRYALWGLLWLVLRPSLSEQSAWISGLLAMLVHNYSHFDDLFLQSPLAALGMGAVLALFWGLPPLLLARRKGLESAIAFHWIQDAARFFAGF